jgi:hypothetical protein
MNCSKQSSVSTHKRTHTPVLVPALAAARLRALVAQLMGPAAWPALAHSNRRCLGVNSTGPAPPASGAASALDRLDCFSAADSK